MSKRKGRRELAHRCIREYRDGGDFGKLRLCSGSMYRGWAMTPLARLIYRAAFCNRCMHHQPTPKARAMEVGE